MPWRPVAALCVLLVWWAPSAAATLLPPPAMPAVVLDAPVNATWAASQSRYWRERGIDGFLFHGLDDGLAALSENDTSNGASEEPDLLREIRVAQQRLRSEGLGRNFFLTTLSGSPHDLDAIGARFQTLGTFTRRAGLQGVAIRLEALPDAWHPPVPDSGFIDGAAVSAHGEALHQAAKAALLAYREAHPAGEALVLADSPLLQGRFWWAVAGGMLEAAGTAETRLHVIDLGTRALAAPAELIEFRDGFRWHARSLLGKDKAPLWDDHGALGMALEPVLGKEHGFEARLGTEAQRKLTAAAKVLSDAYVAVSSPYGGLWEIAARDAEAYEQLHQAVPVAETEPLLPSVHLLTFHTPMDRLGRVGPYTAPDGAPVHVFQESGGAAVLFWGGLPAPTRLESRAGLVETWNIPRAEARTAVPRDGAIVLQPTNAPLLVRGLPVRDWSVPAGLRLQPDAPLRGGGGVQHLRIGWRNGAPIRIDAEISLWPPDDFGVRSSTHRLGLESAATRHWSTELRGDGEAGTFQTFTLAMVQDGGGMLTRTFRKECHLPMDWEAVLPGPATHGPLTLHGTDGEVWFACASNDRQVTAFDADGALQWMLDTGKDGLSALAACGTEQGLLAIQYRNGRIAIRHRNGTARAGHRSSPDYLGATLTWTMLNDDLALLLLGPDSTRALDADGSILWERRWNARPRLPTMPPGRVGTGMPVLPVLLREIGGYVLHGVDADGETAWTTALGPASGGIKIAQGLREGHWQIVAAANDGTFTRIDPESGERQAADRLPVSGPIRALVPVPGAADSHGFLVVQAATALLVSPQGEITGQWTLPHAEATMAGYPDGLIAAQGHRLGAVAGQWREPPFPGPVLTAPCIVALKSGESAAWNLAASGGPVLRFLTLPPPTTGPAPSRIGRKGR